MTDPSAARGSTFGSDADDYDRWRPEYPAAAVDWSIPPGARDAIDLGAGTGKLTAALVERGLRTVAVDVDDRMLERLRRRLPDVVTHAAPAEALPVADAAADVVLVADAWHWFDHAAAANEIERVLRPGGWLCLLWHQPDARSGWAREVARLDPRYEERYRLGRDRVDLPGVRTEEATFAWDWRVTPAHLRGVLATRSGFAALPARDRDERLDQAERIAERVAGGQGPDRVEWPHTTTCVRCFLR